MKFYSIDAEREVSPIRLEVPADLRGHHLALQCACAVQEFFWGLIRDCRRWSENRWRHLAGVSKRTLRRLERRRLVRWDGDDLVVESFNNFRLATLQQWRCDGAKYAKVRWSGSRVPNAKDRSPTRDQGGDRSGRPAIGPGKATAPPSSSSAIEVVEGGGGRLPDGVWERIWDALPNRRGYWQGRARQALEAVVFPDEVEAFLDFLNDGKRTKSWQKSPPTPLMIASDYGDRQRRRGPPAPARPKKSRPLPSREQMAADWAAVAAGMDRSRRKETPT